MKKIYSKKSKNYTEDSKYPICMDSIQKTEGPKKDWDSNAEDKFDRCVDKVGDEIDSKDMKDNNPCWKGYEMVGTKNKKGKEVPNCVPKKSNIIFSLLKNSQHEDTVQDNQYSEDKDIKIEQFKNLVKNHDVSYEYSDDYDMYKKGKSQFDKILDLSKEIPNDIAVKIWNENIDKKIVPGSREYFYW